MGGGGKRGEGEKGGGGVQQQRSLQYLMKLVVFILGETTKLSWDWHKMCSTNKSLGFDSCSTTVFPLWQVVNVSFLKLFRAARLIKLLR